MPSGSRQRGHSRRFVHWRDQKMAPASVEKLADWARGPSATPVERMDSETWSALFASIFQMLAAPAALDEAGRQAVGPGAIAAVVD